MEAISVSKLSTYIKQIFDAEELLHNISVVGEVFGVSLSRNVIYFSLKDENSTLSCVCFFPTFIDTIVEGDKIIVTGSPNYYIKGGKLNFNVVKVERLGQGELFEEFLKLKDKLQNEGLFDVNHKKEIPKNVKRIGVITSKEGAVIQDIKNVAWRRDPSIDIVLYNTKVQGKLAENEIAYAIERMSEYENVDVIVVARGGGSLEDLWSYNTEIVARATFNCKKPIVSAVGHETDFTIIDFVSDLRAPTPSAAAELLTVNRQDKKQELLSKFELLINSFNKILNNNFSHLKLQSTKLKSEYEKVLLKECHNMKLEKDKLLINFENFVNNKYYEIGLKENTLNNINPIVILNKGFAKIEQNGKGVCKVKNIDESSELKIIFSDGYEIAKPLGKEIKNEIK